MSVSFSRALLLIPFAVLSSTTVFPQTASQTGEIIGISSAPGSRGVALASASFLESQQAGTQTQSGAVPDGPCTLFDFDDFGDSLSLGTYTLASTIDITFGPNWLSLVDSDAGGTGRIANEPSESTVGYFLDPMGTIDFSESVGYFGLSYSASLLALPMTLKGWSGPNGTGNLVAQASGSIIGTDVDGANCSGDPTGEFCMWGTLAIQSAGVDILSVTIEGTMGNQFGVDNLQVCSFAPCESAPVVVVLPDPNNRNVPNSLNTDPNQPPFVGNSDFDFIVDNPTGGCGVALGSFTRVMVTTGLTSNQLIPGIGCNGGVGDVRLDFNTTFYQAADIIWNGSPVAHSIPIPANTSLCGVDCTAQAIFIDRSQTPATVRLTNALLLTLGG